MKKKNIRSEAAMREALKLFVKNQASRGYGFGKNYSKVYFYDTTQNPELIAIFDLRDCYRKRSPLKGIKKALSKAIQPKRGKGK